MRIMILDLDTTGLEKGKDFIWHSAYLIVNFDKEKEILSFKERLYSNIGDIGKDEVFLEDLRDVKGIVSHNLSFDKSFLIKEIDDYNFLYKGKYEYCTMEKSKNIVKIYEDYLGDYKFPKLKEVYTHLSLKDKYPELHSLIEKKYTDNGKWITDEAGVKAIMTAKVFFSLLAVPKIKISDKIDIKTIKNEEFMPYFNRFYFKKAEINNRKGPKGPR